MNANISEIVIKMAQESRNQAVPVIRRIWKRQIRRRDMDSRSTAV